MEFILNKNIKDDPKARQSFIQLAIDVYDLSFEAWYQKGYWTDKYIPYTLFDEDRAVANVSANKIETLIDGVAKRYIQIGTVMTDPVYRNRGLSRQLLMSLLKDWENACDGIYLYANDTVLDFYPKFGFEKANEFSYSKNIVSIPKSFIRLDMDDEKNVKLLEHYYNWNNPFSDRPMMDNFGLLMFYCGAFMRDCVYYSKEFDAVVIASFHDEVMTCYDIFCDTGKSMGDVLSAAANENTEAVVFGFTPKVRTGCIIQEANQEDQLFVFSKKENMFQLSEMMMPLLSHS